MKTLSLIFFLFSIFFSLGQQPYVPMAIEGVHWGYKYGTQEQFSKGEYSNVMEYFIEGDTLLNGFNYKKVWLRNIKSINNNYKPPYKPDEEKRLEALIRDDSVARKVYGILFYTDYLNNPCEENQEILLYHFPVQDGKVDSRCLYPSSFHDSVYSYYVPSPPAIQGLDTVRCQFSYNSNELIAWEGIGSVVLLFSGEDYLPMVLPNYRLIYYCRNLNVCSSYITNIQDRLEKRIVVFQDHNKITISFRDINFMSDVDINLYDLNGRIFFTSKIQKNHLEEIHIPTTNYLPQIYFLKITVDQEIPFLTKVLLR
jgi:hypothetical protein